MEKRLILFIVLSFLILFLYPFILPKPKRPQEKDFEDKREKIEKKTYKELISFNNSLFSGKISENGSILSLSLLKFNDRKGLPYPIIKDGNTFSLFIDDKEIFPQEFLEEENSFIYDQGTFKIIKSYEFPPSSYVFNINLSFVNSSDASIKIPKISFCIKSSLGNDPELYGDPFAYSSNNKIKKVKNANITEAVDWIAAQDKYFIFAVKPEKRFSSCFLSKDEAYSTFPEYFLKSGEKEINKIKVYAGPRDYKELKVCSLEDLCELWFLSKFFLFVLVSIESIVKNYGLAIIILTLLIKIILHPLTIKNFKMMKKMSQIKPHIDKIRVMYRNDNKKIQEETMKLYKEHNINPFSGCLPLLLQLPVFFALYTVMDRAIQLRGEEFVLWIKDLSLRDPYFVLPILMGITMFIQQKMAPPSLEPTMDKVMLIMPIVMTFIFFTLPSGLVLYWLAQNIFSIIEHWIIEKEIK